MTLRTATGPQLTAVELQAVLRLRAEVFIVEQASPYLDVDGRDLEPGTKHYWVQDDDRPVSYLRVLAEPDGEQRVGRVCTAKEARGRGLSGDLVVAALEDIGERPSVLEAQVYVQGFYARFGYVAEGEQYVEDGIPHITMRRRAGRTG